MKKIMLLTLLWSYCVIAVAQHTIEVTVNDIESDKGDIIVMLFDQGDGFPMEMSKALQSVDRKAEKGSMSLKFEGLAPGEYAVSVIHDENEDGQVERNFIGMPKERVGASFQTKFGKPSFGRSKFTVTADQPNAKIGMYFLN
ncbi:MAG: DUF2141 domain-containing protein [Bacteroidota bacterium]